MKDHGFIFHHKDSIPEDVLEKAKVISDANYTFKEKLGAAKDLATLNVFIDQLLWGFEDEYIQHVREMQNFIAMKKAEYNKI
jgi:hypothetical protein|tara:strand:+ start:1241 stop:1486 length:246 start_codon:yes stop_codon:yes gene_type:complete